MYICKASNSASWGQPDGDCSMFEKRAELSTSHRKLYCFASYAQNGEADEPLSTRNTGKDGLVGSEAAEQGSEPAQDLKSMDPGSVQVDDRITSSNHNARGHLNWKRKFAASHLISVDAARTGECRNAGSPDRGNLRGDGASIVVKYPTRNRRFRVETKGGSSDMAKDFVLSQVQETEFKMGIGMRALSRLSRDNLRNDKVSNKGIYKIVSEPDVLIAAYAKIKSIPGNRTPGTDGKTLDGIDLPYFHNIRDRIRGGTYQFQPSRRLRIPKASGGERPLGIPCPLDKIVQTARARVLEAIYEPAFSERSHGFRPDKSCHTAIKEIRDTFTAVP